jgi:hypothetical protein
VTKHWLRLITYFPGTQDEERALHRRFARSRVLGEWFRPTLDVVAAVELCKAVWNETA